MYLPGQIVHNIDTGKPITSDEAYSGKIKRHTHYDAPGSEDGSFCPASIEEAEKLLKAKLIFPDLRTPPGHCADCRNWLSNPPSSWCKDKTHKKEYPRLLRESRAWYLANGYREKHYKGFSTWSKTIHYGPSANSKLRAKLLRLATT
jgi:hypothetical protein